MANLRDIRRRIGAVKNTRQITRAMKMVAGAKLRRATERATEARPYQDTLSRLLAGVVAMPGLDLDDPLLRVPERVERTEIVVFGTDRGLCGGFNNNLFRMVDREIAREREAGRTVVLNVFGRKAVQHFSSRGHEIVASRTGVAPADAIAVARECADALRASFEKGEVQCVRLAYNVFRSAGSQLPTLETLLPLSPERPEDEGGALPREYRLEPGGKAILQALLGLYVQNRIQRCFLETEAGEHAARMQAMDNATRNASELIDSLTLAYNRARQAAITTEIIEIVSGAEAL